jgi:hypothetical protein
MKTGTKPAVAATKKATPKLTKQERAVQQLLAALLDLKLMRPVAVHYSALIGEIIDAFPAVVKAGVTAECAEPITRSAMDKYIHEQMCILREYEQEVNDRIQLARRRHHDWVEAAHKHFASMHKLY